MVVAELSEGIRFIYYMHASKAVLPETLVMNYHALSRDSSVDNMKNVLNEYQRLKQSASTSSKTQRPLLSNTKVKQDYLNRKLTKIAPTPALLISIFFFFFGVEGRSLSRLFT